MKNYVYILLAGITALFSCSTDQKNQVEEKAETILSVDLNTEQLKNIGYQEGFPLKELIGFTIYANGTIEVPPQNKTVIAAQFGGFIKSLAVLDGMLVKKGQTLFTIEDPQLIQLQQDYLEVIGNIEYLEAELERQKTLFQQEAGSLKAQQLAKSQYSGAIAQRSGLRAKLAMAGVNMKQLNSGSLQQTIYVSAPFDGVVTKVNVNVGSYAQPTDHLLEIIDLKHSHAELIVFEKDVKHLKIGQKVKLNFPDESKFVGASIFLIGKEIGKDRTVKVHCHLDNENTDIAPGSYFRASIFTDANEHFCVPSEAIVELDGKNVVFYGKKKSGGLIAFYPEEVFILAIENGKTAFEYKTNNRKFTDELVLKGTYDIISALLIELGEE